MCLLIEEEWGAFGLSDFSGRDGHRFHVWGLSHAVSLVGLIRMTESSAYVVGHSYVSMPSRFNNLYCKILKLAATSFDVLTSTHIQLPTPESVDRAGFCPNYCLPQPPCHRSVQMQWSFQRLHFPKDCLLLICCETIPSGEFPTENSCELKSCSLSGTGWFCRCWN